MNFLLDSIETIKAPIRQQMLELRKRIFCDRLKWDIPHQNNLEADIYDFTSAFYLNWVDPRSYALYGSVRLMPMIGENLLNTVFRKTMPDTIKHTQFDWEISRLCVSDRAIEQFDRNALPLLLHGLFIGAETTGIQRLWSNCNSMMCRNVRKMGLNYVHQGQTVEFHHGTVHCLSFEISTPNKQTLQNFLKQNGIKFDVDLNGPGVQDVLKIASSNAPLRLIA